MVLKDDWRLLNDAAYLKGQYKKCIFCWDKVCDSSYQAWFIPEDMSCCICEECYRDFKEMFAWKGLDGWDINWGAD